MLSYFEPAVGTGTLTVLGEPAGQFLATIKLRNKIEPNFSDRANRDKRPSLFAFQSDLTALNPIPCVSVCERETG